MIDGNTKISDLFDNSENQNELEHHGIKDMHWGIRRFQNEDGTLTDEGKLRYGKKIQDLVGSTKNNPEGAVSYETARDYVLKQESDKLYKQDTFRAVQTSNDVAKGVGDVARAVDNVLPNKGDKGTIANRKSYPELSEQELRRRLDRLDLERRYSDAVGDTEYVKTGSEKLHEALQTLTAVTAVAGSIVGIVLAIRHKGG